MRQGGHGVEGLLYFYFFLLFSFESFHDKYSFFCFSYRLTRDIFCGSTWHSMGKSFEN